MYWSMRVMADARRADVPDRRGRGVAVPQAEAARRRAGSCGRRSSAIALPYIAATFGWILTEMGRQPWIVQGLLKTSQAVSPNLSTATIATSLAVFVLLYLTLGVVDFVLMRRYARRRSAQAESATAAARPSPRRRSATERREMSLETFWFCLIAVLWGGYFLLEGFDFGVGMLLPILPRGRARARHDVRVDRAGLGRQRGVAGGRRRRDVRRLPGLVRDDVLGFYIALLLILVLLIVRVVSFEWREKQRRTRAGERMWLWANTIGSVGAPFIWGVALANLLHGVPLNSSHGFAGDFLDLFSPYTVLAGLAVVALFALHGATYLTLRTVGDLCERAAAHGRAAVDPGRACSGSAFVAWTVAVAHDRNGRGDPPDGASRPRSPRSPWSSPLVLSRTRARADGRSP